MERFYEIVRELVRDTFTPKKNEYNTIEDCYDAVCAFVEKHLNNKTDEEILLYKTEVEPYIGGVLVSRVISISSPSFTCFTWDRYEAMLIREGLYDYIGDRLAKDMVVEKIWKNS